MADENVWLDLGFAIYRRRIQLGIKSQRELARRAGLHHNTVGRLERGEPWAQRGGSWGQVEAALELPEGWISEFVANYPATGGPALTAHAVEQAVLDSIAAIAPHVTIRQARLIAAATAKRLEEEGLLPNGRAG